MPNEWQPDRQVYIRVVWTSECWQYVPVQHHLDEQKYRNKNCMMSEMSDTDQNKHKKQLPFNGFNGAI